nr:OmpA family protein [uncultured Flavobacterium sp.]
MKKTLLIFSLATIFFSCNKSNTTQMPENTDTLTTPEITTPVSTKEEAFSLKNIPTSDADLGDFPFFKAPKDAKYGNNSKPKDFDFIVFATPNEIFEVEGKTYRSWIQPERDKEISGRYLYKSYDDAILKAGGVKVFEGNLTEERLKKYDELVTYKGSDGTFIPAGDSQMVCYVINHKSGPIYIVYEKRDFPAASIQIVQQAPFQQTIEKITSDKIVADLNISGKSILYINFDVDKSTLTSDGNDVITEIEAALKKDASLKITIEGHTDNTGDGAHNKKLATDRANSVMQALIAKGIDKSRLNAKGFGAERPLVANDSEENKAKNRRVELVKM